VSFSEILWLTEGKVTPEEEDVVEDMAADVFEEEGSDYHERIQARLPILASVVPC
jgi:hypothetical protein